MASAAFDMREAEDEFRSSNERAARVLGLSESELRRYHRLFGVFDRDSDGCIDNEELMLLLKTIGVAATKETAKAMIDAKDVDNSGKVEYQEFIEIMVDHGGDNTMWNELIERLGEDKVLAQDFMARSEEARQHVKAALASNRLKPDGKFRVSLDALVTLGSLYFYIAILLENVGKSRTGFSNPFKACCEVVFSLVFLLDIVFILNTAVCHENGGRPVIDRRLILRHYLKSKQIYVDVLSVLPLEFILTGWNPATPLGRAARHFRTLKILRLPSMFIIENTGLMSPNLVTFYFRLVPLFLNIVKGVFILHTFSIIWIILNDTSYGYIDALYFVLYTITTVGYGDIAVEGQSQKIYACFLLIVGACLNGLTVGYLTAFIMRSDIEGDKVDKMRQTLAVLRHFKVPCTLQEEILSYQYHVLQHNLGVAYTDVIAGLPPAMQEQVSLYMRVRLVTQVPMFNVCEMAIQIALAQSLKNVVVPPDEYIIVAGEEGHEMFFLSHGFSDVLSPSGDLLATITKGGFFGEVALLVETERHTNVKALTFCDLFILQRTEFNLILDRYPSFASHIHQEIERQASPDGENVTTETEALCKNAKEDEKVEEDATVSVLGVLSKLKLKAGVIRGKRSETITNVLDLRNKDDEVRSVVSSNVSEHDLVSRAANSFLENVRGPVLPYDDNEESGKRKRIVTNPWTQKTPLFRALPYKSSNAVKETKDLQELKMNSQQHIAVMRQLLAEIRDLRTEIDCQAVLSEER